MSDLVTNLCHNGIHLFPHTVEGKNLGAFQVGPLVDGGDSDNTLSEDAELLQKTIIKAQQMLAEEAEKRGANCVSGFRLDYSLSYAGSNGMQAVVSVIAYGTLIRTPQED